MKCIKKKDLSQKIRCSSWGLCTYMSLNSKAGGLYPRTRAHAPTHAVGTPGPEAKKNEIYNKNTFPLKIQCFSWKLYTYMSLKATACILEPHILADTFARTPSFKYSTSE